MEKADSSNGTNTGTSSTNNNAATGSHTKKHTSSNSKGGYNSHFNSHNYGKPPTKALMIRGTNILLISDLNGNLSAINNAVTRSGASSVVCVGDFGFYDRDSVDKNDVPKSSELSEYVHGGNNHERFSVPVYVCYCDKGDARVIAKFRSKEYTIHNLFLVDETSTFTIENVRLLGLGGKFTVSNLFDAGSSTTAGISGNSEYLWTNIIQIGKLVTLADKTHKKDEIRVFLTTQSHNRFISLLAQRIDANVIVSSSHLPSSTAFYPIATMPSKAMVDALEADLVRLRDLWANVEQRVREVANDEVMAYIDEAVKVFDHPFDQSFMYSVLHVGVSGLYTRGHAMLLLRNDNLGFSLAYGNVEKRTTNRKHSSLRSQDSSLGSTKYVKGGKKEFPQKKESSKKKESSQKKDRKERGSRKNSEQTSKSPPMKNGKEDASEAPPVSIQQGQKEDIAKPPQKQSNQQAPSHGKGFAMVLSPKDAWKKDVTEEAVRGIFASSKERIVSVKVDGSTVSVYFPSAADRISAESIIQQKTLCGSRFQIDSV
eukprot:m.21777 g.21777  ORF g.21777 m.21777 type:complete len:541 (+) comp5389_c0_seq1:124-1746(+)